MIGQGLIPQDMMDFAARNKKFSETLLQSMASPAQKEEMRAKLGLNPTPKETVYSENSLRLYRFRSPAGVAAGQHKTPILIVPSLILRYWVMDLMKGHSLIEHLLEQGLDVWLVDWGAPGREHGNLGFTDYVGTFLRRCVRQVRRHTDCDKVHLLGQCLGGTLAAMYTALHSEEIERLVCLTTPVDFEDAGLLSLWTRKETFKIDSIVGAFGPVIPAHFVHACFQFLDVKATVDRYKKLFNNVLDEGFMQSYLALDHWLNDQIPFASPAFRNLVVDLYQENRLVTGKFDVGGRMVDFGQIRCPVMNIAAQYDHVFPEKSVKALNTLVSGPVEYHLMPTGHVTCVSVFPQRIDTFNLISTFFA